MTNTGPLEPRGQRDELSLVLDGKDDGVGVLGQIARGGLTGRVNKLRGQDSEREIRSYDGVVVERLDCVTGASVPVVGVSADVERS